MPDKKPLFSVGTPIPEVLQEVTLYEHTWTDHISEHPEVATLLPQIQATVQYPTLILDSYSVTGNYIFVNQEVVDEEQRALRVPVKPMGGGFGIVVTTYFSGNVTNAGTLVWHRFMSKPGESDK